MLEEIKELQLLMNLLKRIGFILNNFTSDSWEFDREKSKLHIIIRREGK